jgi:hypothetical protein
VIAQELLDALNKVQNNTNLDQNVIWALSEYLQETWKDELDEIVRPFTLGKALSSFFVDLSQHRLPSKISQRAPEMESVLQKTFGATSGSLSLFWTRCAEIWSLALEPYPATAKEIQGYFDLLLRSSQVEKPSSAPASLPAGSDETANQVSVEPVNKTETLDVPVLADQKDVSGNPVQPPSPKVEPEPKTFPKNAYLVLQGTRVIPLNQPIIKIGRQLDNHVILEDPRVSRSHAQLKLINDHFVIFDLNSTGGTFINGQRTSQSVLYPGDIISLAGVKFIYAQELPAKPGEVRIIELGSPFAADRPTAVMHKEQIKEAVEDTQKKTSDLPRTGPFKK